MKTIKLINDELYDVYVMPEAKAKMELYVELCSKEIGWMGFITKEDYGFLIRDVVLLKQEVHAATTEINPQALLELWNATPTEEQCNIKLWGHSHVNMEPNPSGQDDAQMNYFKDGNPWFVRLITNKSGKMNITIYDYENGFEVHTDELLTYYDNMLELREAIQTEIKEKVKEKTYTTTTTATKGNTVYSSSKQVAKATPAKSLANTYSAKEEKDIFSGVSIKRVKDFEEALDDPYYYQMV